MPAESMGFGVTEVDPASQLDGHRDLGRGSACQLEREETYDCDVPWHAGICSNAQYSLAYRN